MQLAKIRVAIRARPLLEWEKKQNHKCTRLSISTENNEIKLVQDENKQAKSFRFDHVFDQTATQQQVYDGCEVDNLILKVIEGYHSTIMAYGQTGSGKTFSMEGYSYQNDNENIPRPLINAKFEGENIGLIPRTVFNLFEKMKSMSSQKQFTLQCSFLQIYNERVYDLLNNTALRPSNNAFIATGLKLRWNPRDQFTVENLYIFECRSPQEVLDLFHAGIKNRVTASHKMNLSSSRSHTIFSIKLEIIDSKNSTNVLVSKLELVDLAGSERIGQTGTVGQQAKESIDINKSLFTLRQVISMLADSKNASQNFIPYRDSKLTSLLKQSIGGSSYCLMLACLNPCDTNIDESVSTLTYATKATYITNQIVKNDDPRNLLIADLRNQISGLTSELEKANQHISFLTQITLKYQEMHNNEKPGIQNQVQQQQNMDIKLNNGKNMDYDVFSDRLIESINMVKELLHSNKTIREDMENMSNRLDGMQQDIFGLQKENTQLRNQNLQYEELLKQHDLLKPGINQLNTTIYSQNQKQSSVMRIDDIDSNIVNQSQLVQQQQSLQQQQKNKRSVSNQAKSPYIKKQEWKLDEDVQGEGTTNFQARMGKQEGQTFYNNKFQTLEPINKNQTKNQFIIRKQ